MGGPEIVLLGAALVVILVFVIGATFNNYTITGLVVIAITLLVIFLTGIYMSYKGTYQI